MTNENPDNILDFALTEISKVEGFVFSKKLFHLLSSKIKEHEITPVIDKLFLDGYIDKVIDKGDNAHPVRPAYNVRVNFHGRVFLKRGGYKSLSKSIKINRFWAITKTCANIINAAAIIIIAFIGTWLSWKSLEHEDKNEQNIKAITTRLDSIVLHRDTVFVIDTTK